MTELLATEQLLEKNIRQRMVRELEKTREELRAQGLDPDEHAPADIPPLPGPIDLESVGDLALSLDADLESKMGEVNVKLAKAEQDARAECAKSGVDYDQRVRDQKKAGGGPPTFTAAAELERLHDQLTLAKNAGASLPHIEEQLADPEIEEKLLKLENMLRDAYLSFGHYYDPASPRGREASALLRADVVAAIAAGESLAGRDLTGVDLSSLDLRGADLQRIEAKESMFMKSDLTGAMLASANLMMAILQRAKIAGASFADANLFRADLLDVEVDHATIMKGADMRQMRYIAPKRDHAAG